MNDPTRRRTLKDLFQAPEPMWLFQAADGRALGPVAEPMLLKGLLRGNLSPQTLVRPVGQPQWRPIAAYTRLTRAIERLQARVSGVRVTRDSGIELASGPRSEHGEPGGGRQEEPLSERSHERAAGE